MEKFVEYIKEEVKRLYETFLQKPMTKLTDVLKREHGAAEKCHICLKEFNDLRNRKVRDHCYYTSLYRGAAHNNCNLKYKIPDHPHANCVSQLEWLRSSFVHQGTTKEV